MFILLSDTKLLCFIGGDTIFLSTVNSKWYYWPNTRGNNLSEEEEFLFCSICNANTIL